MEEIDGLVRAAQGGDIAAYEEIVRRFQGMAMGCAHSLLDDFHLTEDAAQEAFVQAYMELGDLQEPLALTEDATLPSNSISVGVNVPPPSRNSSPQVELLLHDRLLCTSASHSSQLGVWPSESTQSGTILPCRILSRTNSAPTCCSGVKTARSGVGK